MAFFGESQSYAVRFGGVGTTRDIEIMVVPLRRFGERLRGLLARPQPPENVGYLIQPCRQVHMFAMAYPLDVAYLDHDHTIITLRTLRPWTLGPWRAASAAVLEMRAGEIERLGLCEGMRASGMQRH